MHQKWGVCRREEVDGEYARDCAERNGGVLKPQFVTVSFLDLHPSRANK